jgi:hypothetical protein
MALLRHKLGEGYFFGVEAPPIVEALEEMHHTVQPCPFLLFIHSVF